MARERDMCLALDEWKERFLGWISAPTPEALLSANILFDFRPIHGNAVLPMRCARGCCPTRARARCSCAPGAERAAGDAPLGLIRAFATDDEPPHRGRSTSRFAAPRLRRRSGAFALGLGIPDSVPARACALPARTRHRATARRGHVEAFHFLQLLRLRVQDVAIGHASANRLDPDTLNEVDQRMLKESFRQARKLQQRLTQTFQA